METLSHILASFDIFQLIVNAFPQIFNPIAHAFESIYPVFLHYGKNMVSSHPGIISGLLIFLPGYLLVIGFQRMRRFLTNSLRPSRHAI